MRPDEAQCWKLACEDIPEFRAFEDISADKQERPDMIFRANGKIIGVEHFLADLIYVPDNNNFPNGRKNAKEEYKLFEKYEGRTEEQGFADNALSDVNQVLNDEIYRLSLWDYDVFYNKFKEIFVKHENQALGINTSHPYQKTDELYFLIEVPVPNYNWCIENASGKPCKQYINGLPITKDIWNICKDFKVADKLIFLTCQDHNHSRKHYTAVYDKSHPPRKIFHKFQVISFTVNGDAKNVVKLVKG